jgi:oxygen-independent coproporphyrinogen-3 oxidase
VDQALQLEPEQFSVFGYAHIRRMKKHRRMIDEAALPSSRKRLSQFSAIAERLKQAGYRRIGLDHFARADDRLTRCLDEGTLHRNFQGYTADQCPTLIGLGASAVGTLPNAYVQNTSKVGEYRRRIQAGSFAIQRARHLCDDDLPRRDVIERLMCDFTVDLDTVTQRHGLSPDHFDGELARISAFEDEGILRIHGNRITLDESCWPLARSVAAVFDAYLQPEGQRHAAAI